MPFLRWLVLWAALLSSTGFAVAAPAAPASAPAAASPGRFSNLPLQREESSPGGLSLAAQLLLAAALLVALAVVYKLRQRKAMRGGSSGALHAAHALRLAPGASLHVVRWGGEELLVAATASSVSVLSRRTPQAGEPAQGGSA
jgi:Flagellar biosynthesis protein, FliO